MYWKFNKSLGLHCAINYAISTSTSNPYYWTMVQSQITTNCNTHVLSGLLFFQPVDGILSRIFITINLKQFYSNHPLPAPNKPLGCHYAPGTSYFVSLWGFISWPCLPFITGIRLDQTIILGQIFSIQRH